MPSLRRPQRVLLCVLSVLLVVAVSPSAVQSADSSTFDSGDRGNSSLLATPRPLANADISDAAYADAAAIPRPFNASIRALLVHYTARAPAAFQETLWKKLNGDQIEIRFYDDAASRELVARHRPHFLENYDAQLSPVERADYFRYLVLWAFGGLYIDSDIDFVRPVDQWLRTYDWDPHHDGKRLLETIDLVVGVEFPNPQTEYGETGWLPLQLTQFVIAGAQHSDVVERIVGHIEDCVQRVDRRGDVERTLQRTGPAAFTRAILNEIQYRGLVSASLHKTHESRQSDERYPRALQPMEELEKRGQLIPLQRAAVTPRDPGFRNRPFDYVLVLPYRAFGFHQAHGLAEAAELTRHNFQNSWRHSGE